MEREKVFIDYLGPPDDRVRYTEKEHAFRDLQDFCLVERLGLKPRKMHLYEVNKEGLKLVESHVQRMLKEGKGRNFVFFPHRVKGTGGYVIGYRQYLGTGAESMTHEEFRESVKTIDDSAKVLIALPTELDLSLIYGEAEKQGREDVEKAVGQLQGSVDRYTTNLSDLLNAHSVRTLQDIEKIPRDLFDLEKLGIDKMQDPLERIMNILQEDHVLVLSTTHSLQQAIAKQGKSFKLSKALLDHAMATMIYSIIDLESFIKANPDDERFQFKPADLLKIAFAYLNHDIGLWVKPSNVTRPELIKNHASFGAGIYSKLISKDPEFLLFGGEEYRDLILRHHAGINGISQYQINGGGKAFSFYPEQAGGLNLQGSLAIPGQLLFAYEFLLSRMSGWLLDKQSLDEVYQKSKDTGWGAVKDFLGFTAMNWLKSGIVNEALLQPCILERVITTTGIYPAGSEVVIKQEQGSDPRMTSQFQFQGYRGRVLLNGMLEVCYDVEDRAVYNQVVDLRKGLGEHSELTLKRI